jgi:hypothetical protein
VVQQAVCPLALGEWVCQCKLLLVVPPRLARIHFLLQDRLAAQNCLLMVLLEWLDRGWQVVAKD